MLKPNRIALLSLCLLMAFTVFPSNAVTTDEQVTTSRGFILQTKPVTLTAIQSNAIRKQSSGYNIETSLAVDLNNDGLSEIVSLLAKPYDKTSLYRSNFRIAIIDSKNSRLTSFGLPKDVDGGYTGNLSFVDLTNDKIPEIALVSATGGSGGTINLVVFKKDIVGYKIIFNSAAYSDMTTLSGTYKDGYIVELDVAKLNGAKDLKRSFELDVKSRKALYLEMKLYANGKLILNDDGNPGASPWGGRLAAASVADPDKDGKPELIYRTVAKGVYNADSLGELEIGFKWNGLTFTAIHTAFVPYVYHENSLLTDSIGNVNRITLTKNDVSVSPTLSAPLTQELLKSLSIIKVRAVSLPKEMDMQSSEPLYAIEVHYKDGTTDNLLTTETGKFAYRLIDGYGSWVGGSNDKLLQQLDSAFKAR